MVQDYRGGQPVARVYVVEVSVAELEVRTVAVQNGSLVSALLVGLAAVRSEVGSERYLVMRGTSARVMS